LLLDLFAGILTLVAVYRLPLFAAQSIIASCVVLTALSERIFMRRILHRQTYYAAGVVLVGLACLSMSSHSEATAVVSSLTRHTLLIAPVILAVIGATTVRSTHRRSAFWLSALSGCAFGGISIIGRILVYPTPLWLLVRNPLLWALLAYGILGMFFFTAALQRTFATVVNGVMTSTQTIVPLIVGILLLGDTARNGLWLPLWVGCGLVTAGSTYIAFTD
jgi:hypothetical protein